MAFPWGALAYGITKGYSEEETRESQRREEAARTKKLQQEAKQAEDLAAWQLKQRRTPSPDQQFWDNYRKQWGLQTPPPVNVAPQPGQPSAAGPAQPGPPQGALPPPVGMPGLGSGPSGMPGTQAGPMMARPPVGAASSGPPAAIPPYSMPSSGPIGPTIGPMNDALGPPPTAQAMADRIGRPPDPFDMFQNILGQLERSHPGDPDNSALALAKVEQFKPLYDVQRQDELASLRIQHEAQEAAIKTFEAKIKELQAQASLTKAQTGVKAEQRRERMEPFKIEETLAKIGLDKARAKAASTSAEFNDPKMQDLLASLAEKGVTLPSGLRSQKQIQSTLKGLLAKHPDLTSDQIADGVLQGKIDLTAVTKEASVVATQLGKVEFAINDIDQNAPLALAAAKKLNREQFVPINKLLNLQATQGIQDPDLRELAVYTNSLLNAYDVLGGRGGTDMEKRAEQRRNLLTSDSPETYERAINAFVNEGQAAKRAGKKSLAGLGPRAKPEIIPPTNAKGWKLHKDAKGNMAYVSPDGKQFEEVK